MDRGKSRGTGQVGLTGGQYLSKLGINLGQDNLNFVDSQEVPGRISGLKLDDEFSDNPVQYYATGS